MSQPTDHEVADLKSKFATVHLITVGEDAFVVVKPNRLTWRNYSNELSSSREVYTAYEGLCRNCIVWPSQSKFDEMADADPQLVNTVGSEIARLSKLSTEATAKKL